MARHPFIKSLFAVVMLLLFAFSITPKKTIHDLLASHKDKIFQTSDSDLLKINKASFHCKCDNIVAESPFTNLDNKVEWLNFFSYPQHRGEIIHSFDSAGWFSFELRGPPLTSVS